MNIFVHAHLEMSIFSSCSVGDEWQVCAGDYGIVKKAMQVVRAIKSREMLNFMQMGGGKMLIAEMEAVTSVVDISNCITVLVFLVNLVL